MFGLLGSSSQIYGLQQAEEYHNRNNITSEPTSNLKGFNPNKLNNKIYRKNRRTKSSVSDSFRETNNFFSSINAMQQTIKAPSNFIEKLMKTELVNTSYETIKYLTNRGETCSEVSKRDFSSNQSNQQSRAFQQHRHSYPEGILNSFNCLHGSYRSNCDGEFYGANFSTYSTVSNDGDNEMTIKCSKNLLPETLHQPASLRIYQKLPELEHFDIICNDVAASGASSGEFNSSNSDANNSSAHSSTSLNKRLSFGRVGSPLNDAWDYTSSSMDATSMSRNLENNSPTCSSGDCNTSSLDRNKISTMDANITQKGDTEVAKFISPECIQRRKLMQIISNYDQQNKLLQRELAKEKRRRTEELTYVVNSLLGFESKLKTDMKIVNERMQEKDIEICRLVMHNRSLRTKLKKLNQYVHEQKQGDKGVEDEKIDEQIYKLNPIDSVQFEGNVAIEFTENNYDYKDCKVREALQCINCRKVFYDLKDSWTETKGNKKKHEDPTTEHGSSSDDTASSSFYGARRSVRYTSKRTSGNFREYMRSRSMNIDDPSLDNNSEENDSTISREDSKTSYEKMTVVCSHLMDRMNGGNCDSEREYRENAGAARSCSRLSNNSSVSNKAFSEKSSPLIDEDDGIFSPTQEDDFEDEDCVSNDQGLNIIQAKSKEFSETTPKQVYETSTGDWYDSASDQEEITSATPSASQSYGKGAINPVLECVNQILLQQSMEEPTTMDISTNLICENNIHNKYTNKKNYKNTDLSSEKIVLNLPQRSSLSGRSDRSPSCNNSNERQQISSRSATIARKKVHFSTKNSMVHVPRNDEHDVEDDSEENCLNKDLSNNNLNVKGISNHYHPMNFDHNQTQEPTVTSKGLVEVTSEILNYESIYSNEYEPIIGSEHNGSNFYVDMESTTKMSNSQDSKISKLPPALPPKPANLLKFKKSLQQVEEIANEQNQDAVSNTTAPSEPDYCSIAEVNMNITSVQIVADVHHKAESENDVDVASQLLDAFSEIDVEVSTVVSDNTCTDSHKTDEIEEMFADIPKLPNVAAIIAPKYNSTQQLSAMNSDYLVMSPKGETPTAKSHKLIMNNATPINLQMHSTPPHSAQQHKRQHLPNILAEINKRKSLPDSPTAPTATLNSGKSPKPKALFRNVEESPTPNTNLPLQAEFDWYNLDVEYGKAPHNPPDLLKVNDSVNGGCSSINILAEISEDHESIVTTADEYNLDEEFSLAPEQSTDLILSEKMDLAEIWKNKSKLTMNSDICEAVNFPHFSESSPSVVTNTKAKKMKNNLANFEKFIEGSGLSTKPLPNKRKFYFSGPFV